MKKRIEIILVVIGVALLFVFACKNTRGRNEYFFKESENKIRYELRCHFQNDFSGTAYVLVTEVKCLEEGTLYEIKIDADEAECYAYDRFQLGYFFVTEEQIFRVSEELLEQDAEEWAKTENVICQEEEMEDAVEGKGWHKYICIVDEKCEFHSYNDMVETGFYENFTWEKGKGLVEYRSGYGAEKDAIYLRLCE